MSVSLIFCLDTVLLTFGAFFASSISESTPHAECLAMCSPLLNTSSTRSSAASPNPARVLVAILPVATPPINPSRDLISFREETAQQRFAQYPSPEPHAPGSL